MPPRIVVPQPIRPEGIEILARAGEVEVIKVDRALGRDEIAAALRRSPVVIVSGETGSGKTTQLPEICVLAGRGRRGRIGHTQPRRIAATSVARRIADELGSPPGRLQYQGRVLNWNAGKPTARLITPSSTSRR